LQRDQLYHLRYMLSSKLIGLPLFAPGHIYSGTAVRETTAVFVVNDGGPGRITWMKCGAGLQQRFIDK